MKVKKEKAATLIQGYNGCLLFIGILILFLFIAPFILGGLFWWALQDRVDIEWHYNNYYLQQTTAMGGQTGNALFYEVKDGKVEILPHVYGYERDGDFVYLAAAEGYGVIDLKTETADIVLFSAHISQADIENIRYGDNLQFLTVKALRKVISLPHTINAYLVGAAWRDGETFTIGDGRFQYDYARVGETKYHYFQVHGLYGNFDRESMLFDDLTGYYANDSTQMMYVTSPHGYAIVDGLSGTCRIYFTDPELAGREYQKDIYVLDSFEDFTPEEQEMLRKVEKEGL